MHQSLRKRSRLTALALSLSAAVAVLAGCGGSKPAQPQPGAQQPAAHPEAPKEKVLTLSFDVKAVSLDPATSAERTTGVMAEQFYDQLVTRNEKGEFVGKLAESWSTPSATEWVFKLRQGVKFHDGKAFTANDVKFTMDRYMDPNNKSPMAALYSFLAGVEARDDQTVVFKTKEENGTLLSSLAVTPILGDKPGVDWANQAYGTGPYKLAEFKRGEQVVMAKNADYWGAKKPAIDKVLWKEIPEQATRLAALERGDVDFVVGLNAEDLPRLKANKNIQVVQAPTYRIRFLWLHSGKKPFGDPKVREAMRHAIDFDSLMKDIMGGMAEPATGPVAPGVFGHTPQKPYVYDQARAKALLAEAGYPNGFETSLDFPLSDTKQKELAETIAAQLSEVGIKVKLQQKDRAVWLKDLTDLKWDMNLFAHSTTGGDADYTMRRVFVSSANRTGHKNAEMDKWLLEAAKHRDPAKRLEAYAKANEIFWNDGPSLTLFVHTQGYAYGQRVTKFAPPKDDVLKLVDLDVKP